MPPEGELWRQVGTSCLGGKDVGLGKGLVAGGARRQLADWGQDGQHTKAGENKAP